MSGNLRRLVESLGEGARGDGMNQVRSRSGGDGDGDIDGLMTQRGLESTASARGGVAPKKRCSDKAHHGSSKGRLNRFAASPEADTERTLPCFLRCLNREKEEGPEVTADKEKLDDVVFLYYVEMNHS